MNLKALTEVVELAAPNSDNNTTMKQAEKAAEMLMPFVDVADVVCNPTTIWPMEVENIDIDTLREWGVPEDQPLFMHVQVVTKSGRVIEIGVANWLKVVQNTSMYEAVVMVLNLVDPDWKDSPNGDFVAKVEALPRFADHVVPDANKTPAMPDWNNPKADGVLGSRIGDFSKEGTEYKSPEGIVWVKGLWLSMTEHTWKRK